jgi:EmrB/QacA subfamily drug resistance transporter
MESETTIESLNPSETAAGPSLARAVITFALMLGALISAVETTVVSTAMPTVIGQLHGVELYPWVFSAYLLTSTTSVPVYGRLADIYGRRPMYLMALTVFLFGSALSGMAQSMPQLIAFRAVQGLGAGGIMPIALTVIGDMYALKERPRVQALMTGVWGTASLAGPVLGAFITMHLSWRWVFYVNIPVGLLSGALIIAFFRESIHRHEVNIDYLGSLLLTASMFLLLAGAEQTQTARAPVRGGAILAASVALFVLFLWQERRAPDPMLPLDLFRHPVILAATVGSFVIGVMMFCMDAFMPLFMQGARGGTPHASSLVLTPLIGAWSLMAYLGARLMVRFGVTVTVALGSALIVAATLLLAVVGRGTPTWLIVTSMLLMGSGLGPSSTGFLIAAQSAVEWRRRGVVTAANQFARTIGGALGVALLGTLLSARMTAGLTAVARTAGTEVAPNALLDPRVRASLAPHVLEQAQQALGSALHVVYLVLAVVAVASVANVYILARRPVAASST